MAGSSLAFCLLGFIATAARFARAAESPANIKNTHLVDDLAITLCVALAVFLAWRVARSTNRYLRLIACINNEKQQYFAYPNELVASFKKYVADAPLFRKRHMREFTLSRAVNVGTLPSRLQSFLIAGYFALNIVFCFVSINFHGPEKSVGSQFRNRTGVLAVFNMIPLFLLAGRTNPLIPMLRIPFDTFNLIHRWIGRIVVLESIAHAISYFVVVVQKEGGWAALRESLSEQMIMTGSIGVLAFIIISIQAWGPIRHAFYEFFLHTHITLVAIAVGVVWVHTKEFAASQALLIGVIVLWVADRLFRLLTIVRRNIGNGGTKAEVEVLPGEAMKVTLNMARPWKFTPGQHAYLYVPRIGWWTSHPFSLAWSHDEENLSMEKGMPYSSQDVLALRKTKMSFVIRRRTGFTEKLYKKANSSPSGKFVTSAFVEGPYGRQSLCSYGTVVLFAAGVGITHQVPHVRELVAAHGSSTGATRRVTLVWVIQSPEHLEWIRPWMTNILSMDGRRDILKILLFVTRPRSTKEIHSPSSSVQMFPGRPNIQALVEQEVENSVGAIAVTVCGTGSMSDDVRLAARQNYLNRNVDLVENAFSW